MSKLKQSLQNHWLLWVLSLVSIGVFFWLYAKSDSLQGGSDTYGHYLISRYALKHNSLFVDQWGKPFFTLISMPFSMIGKLTGLVVYNILLAILTGVLMYFIAIKLNFKYPIIAFLMTVYAPGFFDNVVSGLTEITGAFVLVWFIYLYLNKNLFWATILISFLPFVRSEGFIILFIVFVYYVVKGYYKYLGLLTTGSLLYSYTAFMLVDDVLWLFGSNPYLQQKIGVYGSGSFWHYTGLHEAISGNPITILWFGGLVLLGVMLVKSLKQREDINHSYLKFFVFLGAFITFTFIHSYIWWKGSLGSAGFPRVFAAVLPLMILIAMEAVNWLARAIKKPIAQHITLSLIGVIIVANNFIVNKLPYEEKRLEHEHSKVFKWVHEQGFDKDPDQKIFHVIPMMNVVLDMDPYDDKKIQYLFGFQDKAVKSGDLVIWDGLFSVNDARVPLDSFKGNPDYQFIKYFDGNKNPMHEVYVFRKK